MLPAPNIIRRDAAPHDHNELVVLLGHAFTDRPVDRWLDPRWQTRHHHARYLSERATANVSMFHDVVQHALTYGWVRVAQDTGAGAHIPPGLVAASLWLPYPADGPDMTPASVTERDREPREVDHLLLLETMLAARHPSDRRHAHLWHLAVAAGQRDTGVERYLLTDHHRDLDRTGTPAYTVADTVFRHDLLSDLGYSDIGAPIMLPGCGSPLWPMWREPGQDGGPR